MEKNSRLWNVFKEKLKEKLGKIEGEERNSKGRKVCHHPPSYECVICYELMENPTTASDGYSYERKSLDDLVRHYHGVSPLTRRPLNSEVMFPNLALKKAIEYYKAS